MAAAAAAGAPGAPPPPGGGGWFPGMTGPAVKRARRTIDEAEAAALEALARIRERSRRLRRKQAYPMRGPPATIVGPSYAAPAAERAAAEREEERLHRIVDMPGEARRWFALDLPPEEQRPLPVVPRLQTLARAVVGEVVGQPTEQQRRYDAQLRIVHGIRTRMEPGEAPPLADVLPRTDRSDPYVAGMLRRAGAAGGAARAALERARTLAFGQPRLYAEIQGRGPNVLRRLARAPLRLPSGAPGPGLEDVITWTRDEAESIRDNLHRLVVPILGRDEVARRYRDVVRPVQRVSPYVAAQRLRLFAPIDRLTGPTSDLRQHHAPALTSMLQAVRAAFPSEQAYEQAREAARQETAAELDVPEETDQEGTWLGYRAAQQRFDPGRNLWQMVYPAPEYRRGYHETGFLAQYRYAWRMAIAANRANEAENERRGRALEAIVERDRAEEADAAYREREMEAQRAAGRKERKYVKELHGRYWSAIAGEAESEQMYAWDRLRHAAEQLRAKGFEALLPKAVKETLAGPDPHQRQRTLIDEVRTWLAAAEMESDPQERATALGRARLVAIDIAQLPIDLYRQVMVGPGGEPVRQAQILLRQLREQLDLYKQAESAGNQDLVAEIRATMEDLQRRVTGLRDRLRRGLDPLPPEEGGPA